MMPPMDWDASMRKNLSSFCGLPPHREKQHVLVDADFILDARTISVKRIENIRDQRTSRF
jgi:hypothetical protein